MHDQQQQPDGLGLQAELADARLEFQKADAALHEAQSVFAAARKDRHDAMMAKVSRLRHNMPCYTQLDLPLDLPYTADEI